MCGLVRYALGVSETPDERPVVLFDGVCNLCNSAVDFIIRRDRRARLRLASLQSDAGHALLERVGVDPSIDSIVFVHRGRWFVKSAAAVRVALRLRFPWPVLAVFWLVPRPLRDLIYDWVARNRLRWFGTRDTCRMPDPGLDRHWFSG